MAYEMLTGNLPLQGPDIHDFREQHLHRQPPAVSNVPVGSAVLIEECLYKGQEARPGAANVLARLDRIAQGVAQSPGRARLEEASRKEVQRQADLSRQQSAGHSEAERRTALAADARQSFVVSQTSCGKR